MALFEHFSGKQNDLTEIKIKKAVLAASIESDTNFPGAATSSKIFNLGVFENNTIKSKYSASKSIEIHTGASKVLSIVASVEGTGVSPWELAELQDVLDQTNITLYVLDVDSYYSDDLFDLNSKFIPDYVAVKAHLILRNTQISLAPSVVDKEVERISITARTEDTAGNIDNDYFENAYVVGGTNPWLIIFNNFFLDTYLENNSPKKEFLFSIRSMCHMFWNWTKNNVLTQNNSSQFWDHVNTALVAGGNAVYDVDHYELGNGATGILSESTSAVSTGRLFGYLIADFSINTTFGSIFKYDCDSGAATQDGYEVSIVDSDSFIVYGNFGAGANNFSISSGNIVGENFTERSIRIFLLDFESETVYYYNLTKNIFQTFTNSASNTVTFTSSANGVVVGSDLTANNLNIYKLGYAIW